MPVLGITGGIASGKSTVLQRLASALDATIFDSDRYVHLLLSGSREVIAEIEHQFGPGAIGVDGAVDRTKLGVLIFNDDRQRKALEEIVHPRVRKEWRSQIAALSGSSPNPEPWLLVDIPLFFETGAENEIPDNLLVGCSQNIQLDRLVRERGLTPSLAQSMIDAQMPMAAKVALAARVIWNDGTHTALARQLDRLTRDLLSA